MGSRWFNLAVVGLWLASMTWLVTDKILPSLLVGDPPNYRTILAARKSEPPVGWRLLFNGQPIGWALSAAFPLPNELTEVRSRVHFDELPLADFTPGLLGQLLGLTKFSRVALEVDTGSTLLIDPLGRLSRFTSTVRLEDFDQVIHMEGTVENGDLKVSLRAGEVTYDETVGMPSDAILSDSLSPQTRLPGLRLGQKWTVPSVSPLSPSFKDAVEILHAAVEQTELIEWNGQKRNALVVVFRSDPGIGLGTGKRPRGRLWVLPDGTVVRQEVSIFGSKMTFVRMGDPEAEGLADRIRLQDSPMPLPPREYESTSSASAKGHARGQPGVASP